MSERGLLPVRFKPSLLRRAARAVDWSAPDYSTQVEALLDCLREGQVQGVSILASSRSAWPTDPSLVLVHEPTLPDVRVRLLEALSERGLWNEGLLCLTASEWGIWSRTAPALALEEATPLWGEPLVLGANTEPREQRRARLRAASSLFFGPLHRALWRRDPDSSLLASELRDRLERESSPVAFPPRSEPEASSQEVYASVLGAFHATFGGEVAVDEGGSSLEAGADEGCSARSLPAVRDLVRELLADIPSDFVPRDALALYLLPGPYGSRLSWQLLAVVEDDAALDRCARLRFRLEQHLRLLPRREVEAAFGQGGGPVVMPLASLKGLLRRRLFGGPLRRLAIRKHRELLAGQDVLEDAFEGPDLTPEDLAFELSDLITSTQALWGSSSSTSSAHDLFFGRWPALIHLLRNNTLTTELTEAQGDLTASVDPAQAFAGTHGLRKAWSDPGTADISRSREFLRDRGPMLLRLQEVAGEVLLSRESSAPASDPAD